MSDEHIRIALGGAILASLPYLREVLKAKLIRWIPSAGNKLNWFRYCLGFCVGRYLWLPLTRAISSKQARRTGQG